MLLTLTHVCQGQAEVVTVVSAISDGVKILKGLNGLFSKSSHKMTDVTPPGLHFDMMDDQSYCQFLQGIKMSDFASAVTEIIESEFQNPEDMKTRVLRGKWAPINKVLVSHFKYETGIGGSAMYGFIATLKNNADTFDLVICTQVMKFKLAPRRILHDVKQSSLFSSSKSQYITFEEASISQEQKEQIENYLNRRLFDRFVKDFRHMIADNSGAREAISYCKADQAEDCY